MDQLPDFDRELGTRNVLLVGLGISWIAAIICVALGSDVIAKSNGTGGVLTVVSAPSAFSQIGFPLLLDILVALCTDCMGYIHTTSLRWALFDEHRLQSNSNLRLFSAARHCPPNHWFINIFSVIFLIISYAASSQVFPLYVDLSFGNLGAQYQYTNQYGGLANGVAITALGIGLLGQAVITTWGLRNMGAGIHSWSSNPLNNTLAFIHFRYLPAVEPNESWRTIYATRRRGPSRRRLSRRRTSRQGYQYRGYQPSPGRLNATQPSACSNGYQVSLITVFIWVLAALTLVWAGVVFGLANVPWSWSFADDINSPSTIYRADIVMPIEAEPFVSALIITCAVQALYTISLHCVELLVNSSRDEGVWRKAAPRTISSTKSCHGARLRGGSITAAMVSWQTLILFAFKPLVHWLFGLSMSVMEMDFDGQAWAGAVLSFRSFPTFVLGGVMMLLAIFTTILATLRPKGYQPAAWGNLEKLASWVDDWGVPGEEADTRLWWGDKGNLALEGRRRAGTSHIKDMVGPIRQSSIYELCWLE